MVVTHRLRHAEHCVVHALLARRNHLERAAVDGEALERLDLNFLFCVAVRAHLPAVWGGGRAGVA